MSSVPRPGRRTCQPCRDAKVKCDRTRPTCARCRRQQITCHGYTDDVFRDSNTVTANAVQRSKRSPVRDSDTGSGSGMTPNDDDLRPPSWLKSDVQVPRNLQKDLDTRVVEAFFKSWVMHPCNHNISPGHLQDLPNIYHQSLPGRSARLAIEALAYADVPGYEVKARSRYGAALARVRDVIDDAEMAKRDAVLAALLIIDNFELMHHSRSEPLGPHSAGLVYVLRMRGDEQFFNSQSFSLWRIAHHRLQARQILLREMPHPEQEIWMRKLNDKQPDLHISTHVFQISRLCAEAQEILDDSSKSADAFLQKISALIDECEDWMNHLPDQWKAKIVMVQIDFPLQEISLHHDIWLAYMLNFHNASRICMREALLDVMTQRQGPDLERRIQENTTVITELSKSLLETMPQLLGLVDFSGQPRQSEWDLTGSKIGKGLGGFFGIYSLFTIRACKYTIPQYKTIADDLWDWIHKRNEQL